MILIERVFCLIRLAIFSVCCTDIVVKEDLDFIVLFSSIVGVLGNVRQADYAGANAFLDGYAEYRNERVKLNNRKGKRVSIHWPLWDDGGMEVGGEVTKIKFNNMKN